MHRTPPHPRAGGGEGLEEEMWVGAMGRGRVLGR